MFRDYLQKIIGQEKPRGSRDVRADGRDLLGHALGHADRRLHGGARHQGRDVRGAGRRGPGHAPQGRAHPGGRRPGGRHLRHGRRRDRDVQHLHRDGLRRGRLRGHGRQARQPLGLQPLRQRRPDRSARGRPRRLARPRRGGRARDRHRVSLRAPLPRRHEARGRGTQGARAAQHLQHARPAHQPGRRRRPAARGLRPPADRDVRRGAAAARTRNAPSSCTATTAWTRFRSARPRA